MLLDTCVLLWLAADQSRLSDRAREVIREHAGSLYISAFSAFEIGAKHRKGALVLPLPPEEWIAEALEHHGVQEIPMHWRIAEHATALPALHRDPCDRIIIATAIGLALPIVTPDRLISQYPDVRTVW